VPQLATKAAEILQRPVDGIGVGFGEQLDDAGPRRLVPSESISSVIVSQRRSGSPGRGALCESSQPL
jgi:hypothetical protein